MSELEIQNAMDKINGQIASGKLTVIHAHVVWGIDHLKHESGYELKEFKGQFLGGGIHGWYNWAIISPNGKKLNCGENYPLALIRFAKVIS